MKKTFISKSMSRCFMKINYNEKMKEIISNLSLDNPPSILLHSCCAPCSSTVISILSNYFNITVIYYNPNIEPFEEYEKRKEEQIRLINTLPTKNKVSIIDADYDNDLFHKKVKSLEHEKEGGARCSVCYYMRLEYTAKVAKKQGFDYFGTTLSVSPYKNAQKLNEIGQRLALEYQVPFLVSDFKKENGYKNSIILSKKYNLYRQNYCGCIYSKPNLDN